MIFPAIYIEERLSLNEVCDARQSYFCSEDIVFPVVKMGPLLDRKSFDSSRRQIPDDKRVADLRPQRDVSHALQVFLCLGVSGNVFMAAKCVIAD